MSYPTYLVHFNKNHSPKNGRFTSGDGDGDGISNDHMNQLKKNVIEIGKQHGVSDKEINKVIKGYQYTISRVGSSKTKQAYYDYVMNANNGASDKKIKKDLLNYNKEALKDIKELNKIGDTKLANQINANRMYIISTSGPEGYDFANSYFQKAVSNLVKEHGADPSKSLDFVMDVNEELGGLTFTFKDQHNFKTLIKE